MINSNKKTRGTNAAAIPLASPTNSGGHRPKVLVVDDDRRLVQTIADSLETSGIDALAAFDGNAGLAVALSQEPALIILDSRMPCRSGYLVMEFLAAESDLQIPIIMLSENEGHRHRSYAQMLGAIDFVEKPINTVELVKRVLELLAESASVS